jgi:hypothetical protein
LTACLNIRKINLSDNWPYEYHSRFEKPNDLRLISTAARLLVSATKEDGKSLATHSYRRHADQNPPDNTAAVFGCSPLNDDITSNQTGFCKRGENAPPLGAYHGENRTA